MGGSSEQKTAAGVRAGQRIKSCREDRNWSQRELSENTKGKLSSSRIANYEQGIRELGIQEAEILGDALKIQPAYLMGITALKTPLSPAEEELVRNYRALPENERDSYFKRIEALALAYRTPVTDEQMGPGWTAPPANDSQTPRAPKGPSKSARRKTAKQ